MAVLRVCILGLLSSAILAEDGHLDHQRERARRGFEYLLAQRDPMTLKFPQETNAPGILGMLAWDPFIFENETESRMELQRQHVATDFLFTLNDLRSLRSDEAGQDSALTLMDDATLLEYSGALHGLCVDQRNFYGHDIVNELRRRVAEHADKTVNHGLYGGLVIALCNAGEPLTRKQIRELGVTANADSLYQAEQDALKLLGALCISEKRSEKLLSTTHLDDLIVPRLVDALDSIGDNEDFTVLALTLQALIRAPSDLVKADGRVERLGKALGSMQSDDGSFGSSIALTSLAMPAFTGHTASDFRQVPCRASEETLIEELRIPFVVIDNVVSHQHTRATILAVRGESLSRALNRAFHPDRNEVLKIRLGRRGQTLFIVRINKLGRRLGRWRVFRRDSHGGRTDITGKLALEKLDGSFSYNFVFDRS